MKQQRFTSVWDALEDDPEVVANIRMRSALMMDLIKLIETSGITQQKAVWLFGVNQPRVSDLLCGKIELFSLDALVTMATRAGVSPVIERTQTRLP